ncbi:MAG: tRNA epoxyqueuosine(34) reductase QueG [Deltaproteobacteria bacterium]|nr:tRNA epoxyqueuosine(34) reductase QueG [Deltaproteobacteria bacterium]
MSAADLIRARAGELGFDAVAFARAVPLDVDHSRYRAFLEAGYHGELSYLADNVELRRDVSVPELLEGTRTVIALARRYARADEDRDPPLAQTIARYARGRDYHNFVEKRARLLAKFIRRLGEGVGARAFVDAAPVLERAWAARAGLGFIGKNGLLIVPGQGSYCLLGEVLTTLELAPEDYGSPIGERCGSCTACLEACPTSAFVAPFVLDARRCVSYQTIERRTTDALEADFGERLFGCDACQEVCPYNRVAPSGNAAPFAPLERWGDVGLATLVTLDESAFFRLTDASPVRRATRATLAASAVRLAARRLARAPDDADARRALDAARHHDDPAVVALAARLAPHA